MTGPALNADVVIAAAHLLGRAGAKDFELGHDGDPDTPGETVTWWVVATWQGMRVMTDKHPTPSGAALDIAERVLAGATCKCGRPVTLSDAAPGGCRWRMEGPRWVSGCTAPPVRITGKRGDTAAIQAAAQAAARGRKR
jgi:hypothetical protein